MLVQVCSYSFSFTCIQFRVELQLMINWVQFLHHTSPTRLPLSSIHWPKGYNGTGYTDVISETVRRHRGNKHTHLKSNLLSTDGPQEDISINTLQLPFYVSVCLTDV